MSVCVLILAGVESRFHWLSAPRSAVGVTVLFNWLLDAEAKEKPVKGT